MLRHKGLVDYIREGTLLSSLPDGPSPLNVASIPAYGPGL